jgi:hypothetical protein
MSERKWNVLVCIDKDCACDDRRKDGGIPDGCPYKLLHLVDTRMSGFQKRRHQSGKTTELVSLANDLARNTGKPVYFVVANRDMVENVKGRFIMDGKVMFVSVGQVRNGWMRGMARGFAVMDEVHPEEWEQIRVEMKFHEVVAAFWTD